MSEKYNDYTAFEPKFREYIDSRHQIQAGTLQNKLTGRICKKNQLDEKIIETLESAILSKLLYAIDPVGYVELFEKWIEDMIMEKLNE